MPFSRPRRGSTKNPDRKDPTIAPTVFSAYALPTSWPTESRPPVTTRTVSGKTPPISSVAGSTVMQASAN